MPETPASAEALAIAERIIAGPWARGSLDRDGIMIRAAAVLGDYHARQGFEPYLRRWNTHARSEAYRQSYWAALDHLRSK